MLDRQVGEGGAQRLLARGGHVAPANVQGGEICVRSQTAPVKQAAADVPLVTCGGASAGLIRSTRAVTW